MATYGTYRAGAWYSTNLPVLSTQAVIPPAYFYTNTVTSSEFVNGFNGQGGTIFVQVTGGGGERSIRVYPISIEAGGREVVAGPRTFDGVRVTAKTYVPRNEHWVRQMVKLHNPTNSTITVRVRIENTYGYGANTRRLETLSGDRNVTTADRWVVMTAAGCCQPHIAHNFDGPGGEDSVDSVTFADFNPFTEWAWQNISLAPGKTKIFVWFTSARTTGRKVRNTARNIDDTPVSLWDKMSINEINNVENWKAELPPGILGILSVDENGEVSLALFSCAAVTGDLSTAQAGVNAVLALLPLVGLVSLRRRRRA